MMKMMIAAAALLVAACGNNGVMEEIERAEREQAVTAQESAQQSAEWLAQIRAQPGVEARPSGLLIEVRSRGANQSLARPTAEAAVLVHYEGRLADGRVFDSSFERNEPSQFPLRGVVDGFSEAIQQMRPGDEIVATFPMELGYGPEGRPPEIPPAAALQFRIILLAYQEPGGQVIQAPAPR
jgi:FKBP-type peptidyl-prolyl cis-trans isomerase